MSICLSLSFCHVCMNVCCVAEWLSCSDFFFCSLAVKDVSLVCLSVLNCPVLSLKRYQLLINSCAWLNPLMHQWIQQDKDSKNPGKLSAKVISYVFTSNLVWRPIFLFTVLCSLLLNPWGKNCMFALLCSSVEFNHISFRWIPCSFVIG